MNWKLYGRKQSWSNLRQKFDICLKGHRKITKYLSQDGQSLAQDFKLGLPKYEAGMLIIRLQYAFCAAY